MLHRIAAPLRAAMADRSGISSLEYIVLAVGVLTGLLAAAGLLTGQISTFFGTTIPGLL